jgi:hypothetical protein
MAESTLTLKDTSIYPQEVSRDLKEYPVAYELCRRNKSLWRPNEKQWRKQRVTHAPKDINAPLTMALSLHSRCNAGPTKGNVEIMYVPNAPTIFRRDYIDAAGNLQPGLEKLYGASLDTEQYRRGIKEGIVFTDGFLFLNNFGGINNRVLLEYVYHHALNEGGPKFERTKDLNPQLLFKPFLPEQKAEFSLEKFDKETAAIALIASVRDKKGHFIPEKLNALCGVFNLGGGLGPDENNQKFEQLIPRMKGNPSTFLSTYEEATEDHRMTVKMAQQFGLLAITAKDAKMMLPDDSRTIYEFKDEKAAEKEEAIIFYFLGGVNGKRDYSILCGEVENKKMSTLK